MRAKTTQRLTLSALLCALCAVLSQIQIPLPPVPISLSLMGVYLCGALLGPHWSAAAVGCYVVLGAVGVPVYAGFAGGVSVLLGPTGGFLIGYILCAWIISTFIHHFGFTRKNLILSMTTGTLACYALGTAWFSFVSGSNLAGSLSACVLPFIPGDALKVLLTTTLCLRLQKPLHAMGL